MKPKKKILFFFNDFQIGGAHLQMTYLIEELKATHYEPVICTHMSDGGGLRDAYLKLDVKIYNLARKHPFDLSIFRKLKAILEAERIDIIVLFLPQNFVYFRMVRKLVGRNIHQVGLLRAMGFWLGHKSKAFQLLENVLASRFIKSSDIVLTNSRAIKARYDQWLKLPQDRIRVIPNASDFVFRIRRSREEVRTALGVSPEVFLVVMVARLDPWKDFDTLFAAAEAVRRQTDKVRFILCGGGELMNSLQEKLQASGLTATVSLLGEQKNAPEYINASDLSVLSTRGEGFSNAIMESMALAKPVIATDAGGNSESIGTDGSCGYLVAPKDHLALARRILELEADREQAQGIGARAKERIFHLCNRKRNMQLFIEQFDSLYTQGN
jgi:glycosyltransferase involved in cell wall biosynthesis